MSYSRRQFHGLLGASLATSVADPLANLASAAETGRLETFVPTRAITRGPLNHWFGYYDKREFDPSNRFVLSNEVSFEGRAPTGDDSIQVGFVDTQNEDRWQPVGRPID